MCKSGFDNKLYRSCVRTNRRRAFSLAELIVSVGVLALLLALAGQVMSLTVQSTGQARSLTQVNQSLRMLEQTMRQDLSQIPKGQSVMVVVGNPVAAYWTQDSKDADNDADATTGYPHVADPERTVPNDPAGKLEPPRADMLMFFTADESARSFFHAQVGAAQDVSSAYQQVVYGHVVPGKYLPLEDQPTGSNTLPYEFDYAKVLDPFPAYDDDVPPASPVVDPEKTSLIPAEQWHLGRRTILLRPDFKLTSPLETLVDPELTNGRFTGTGTSRTYKAPEYAFTDVLYGFNYVDQVLTPSASVGVTDEEPWPAIFGYPPSGTTSQQMIPFSRSFLDEAPPARLSTHLAHFLLPSCASFKVEWTLDPLSSFVDGALDGERQIYWFDPGALLDDADPVNTGPYQSLRREYERLIDIAQAGDQQVMDAENTAVRIPRLGGLLERLYDRSGFYHDPANTGTFGQLDGGDEPNERYGTFGHRDRPNIALFTPDYVTLAGNDEIEVPASVSLDEYTFVFPAALRITVDIVDDQHRLERPTRHVMVIPVGGS